MKIADKLFYNVRFSKLLVLIVFLGLKRVVRMSNRAKFCFILFTMQ